MPRAEVGKQMDQLPGRSESNRKGGTVPRRVQGYVPPTEPSSPVPESLIFAKRLRDILKES